MTHTNTYCKISGKYFFIFFFLDTITEKTPVKDNVATNVNLDPVQGKFFFESLQIFGTNERYFGNEICKYFIFIPGWYL